MKSKRKKLLKEILKDLKSLPKEDQDDRLIQKYQKLYDFKIKFDLPWTIFPKKEIKNEKIEEIDYNEEWKKLAFRTLRNSSMGIYDPEYWRMFKWED